MTYHMKFVGLVAHECDVCEEVTNDVGLYSWEHKKTGDQAISFRYCSQCSGKHLPNTMSGRTAHLNHYAALCAEGNKSAEAMR